MLVSALGGPDTGNLLQQSMGGGDGGVLSAMKAEAEIATDLAIAAAAAAGAATGPETAQDTKAGLKHELEEGAAETLVGSAAAPGGTDAGPQALAPVDGETDVQLEGTAPCLTF